jgi:lipoprotein NlpD
VKSILWAWFTLLFIGCLLISACDDGINFAPVTEINALAPIPREGIRRVTQGEALNEIDWGSTAKWIWPAKKGKIINYFSPLNKGINISGYEGAPIYAVASGKIVYCGNGLRGYGNLIILKHNSLYLSTYAHNRVVFVKEGQWVRQGQIIAEMGRTGADKIMLHFEIRRAGKPIDPINLLNS